MDRRNEISKHLNFLYHLIRNEETALKQDTNVNTAKSNQAHPQIPVSILQSEQNVSSRLGTHQDKNVQMTVKLISN